MKKLLNASSVLAIIAGLVLVAGGVWGIGFTYKNIKVENITTPPDASMPGKQVVGPLTLKSQADVIRMHTLKTTGGKTYAEMPRQIEKLDENGQPVLGTDGKAVMVPNTARDIWITATTLTTALHLGILTYVFSALVILFGLISLWTGFIFCKLAKKQV
ncbi:MAG: hypothetical protein KBC12_01685 [Candidatus Pacebacteria bacterium]|nr:hypothetical protein [Candidatus Paceibacterota bacterium]MBP9851398.1 hypothetical protein [Candidatus Paceibacterota bacterium]